MKSIVTYSNCISFTSNRDIGIVMAETQELFAKKIDKLGSTKLGQEGNTAHFSSGMFRFVWSRTFFVALAEGTIKLTQNDKSVSVKYELNLAKFMLVSLFLTSPAFFIWNGTILEKIVLFFVLNLWYAGGNAAIEIFRFNRFVKGSVAEILEREPPAVSKKQEEWIADNFKCDACGYSVKSDDETCPDCGIKLR
jgi:hypothetical protein